MILIGRVDPESDVSLRESTDGGATWHDSAGLHADQHAVAWDPKVPGLVYNGDDGGVYVSAQNGATNTWTHAQVEPWNRSYHMSVSQQDPRRHSPTRSRPERG